MRQVRDFLFRKCLNALPSGFQRRLFVDVANRLGVSRLTIAGRYGHITGLMEDTSVFRRYIASGVWDEPVSRIFVDHFARSRGGTFIDIGANIGLTLIPVARNHRVACHGFEPSPIAFDLLDENVRRNIGPPNVWLHNVALFSDPGPLRLSLEPGGRCSAGVHSDSPERSAPERHDDRFTVAPGVRLDDVLDPGQLARPIGVKMSAEGCEQRIYQGGRSVIGLADLLVMEYWPYGMKKLGGDSAALLDMLRDDFRCARIIRPNDDNVQAEGFTEVLTISRELGEMWERSSETDVVNVVLSKKKF